MRTTVFLKKLPEDVGYDIVQSPVGELMIIASTGGLHYILWQHQWQDDHTQVQLASMAQQEHHEIIVRCKQQLNEFFSRKRREFDLPLAPIGTAFQLRAWSELRTIAYGETISYSQQALRLGDRNKARAVGMANSHNPLPIIIPCHRVISRNGRLSGFAAGVDCKAYLLSIEKE